MRLATGVEIFVALQAAFRRNFFQRKDLIPPLHVNFDWWVSESTSNWCLSVDLRGTSPTRSCKQITNTSLLSYVIHPPLQFSRLMLVDLLLPKLIYCLVESAEHILVGTWISVICLDSFCWMSKTQDHVLRVCTEGKKGLRKAWGRWDWDFQTGWLVVCSWWSCMILYQCNRLVGRCLYGHWGMSDLWINVNGSVTRASRMEVVKLLKWQ